MSIFLYLSLLVLISCNPPPTSPCDDPFKLSYDVAATPPLYNLVTHSFDCGNDSLIYTPDGHNDEYKIELNAIKCNVDTKQWETLEKLQDLIVNRPIKVGGKVECKKGKVMNCYETRLEYISNNDVHGAKDPKKKVVSSSGKDYSYSCDEEDHYFFYIQQFAASTREGLYLRSHPKCYNSKLTAPFTSSKEPLEISHLGSITCKEFSCKDSNNHPLSWIFFLKMDMDCLSAWEDCRRVDWYNEEYPCGENGHELVIYFKGEDQGHWLTNNYFECGDTGHILFVDSNGKEDIITKDDKIVCRMPPPCVPLMSDPNGKYGCFQRSNCENIDPSVIPHSHLSSFNGRCPSQSLLKIVHSEDSSTSGIDLSLISCEFGLWKTVVSPDFDPSFLPEEIIINEKTNFVCEARVDFYHCPPPESNCAGGDTMAITDKWCSAATVGDPYLNCETDRHLVLRTVFDDTSKRDIVKPVKSKMVCDRKKGIWMSAARPYIEPMVGFDWKSYIVCAATSCTNIKLTSECNNDPNCEKVVKPEYWIYAHCHSPSQLVYSKNKVKLPVAIDKLHCEAQGDNKYVWKFTEDGVEKEASDDDNFYCFEEEPEKAVRQYVVPQTSLGCQSTRLDSVCFHDAHICMPVRKEENRDSEGKLVESRWKCDGPRSLFYYETGSAVREELYSLTCKPTESSFWKARKKTDMTFVPPPHSNFVCLSVPSTAPKEEKPTNVESKGTVSEKKFRWPIPIPESIIIITSLLTIAFSLVLILWANKKAPRKKRMERTRESFK